MSYEIIQAMKSIMKQLDELEIRISELEEIHQGIKELQAKNDYLIQKLKDHQIKIS